MQTHRRIMVVAALATLGAVAPAQAAKERTAVSKTIPTQDRRWELDVTVTKPRTLVVQVGARHGQQVQVRWSTQCRTAPSADALTVNGGVDTSKSLRRRLNITQAGSNGQCVVMVFAQMHGGRAVSVSVRGKYAKARGKRITRLDNLPYPAPPMPQAR